MRKGLFIAVSLLMALPAFGEGPKDFVGTWKSDPGGPNMTRKLALEGGLIVMTEIQPGRNGGPDTTVLRKYPTDGSKVTMDSGFFAGATATGKMEGNVLTVDTVMKNGQKYHDVWTLSPDGKNYTNEMVISGGAGGRGRGAGAPPAGGRAGGGGGAPRTIKFSFTKEE